MLNPSLLKYEMSLSSRIIVGFQNNLIDHIGRDNAEIVTYKDKRFNDIEINIKSGFDRMIDTVQDDLITPACPNYDANLSKITTMQIVLTISMGFNLMMAICIWTKTKKMALLPQMEAAKRDDSIL